MSEVDDAFIILKQDLKNALNKCLLGDDVTDCKKSSGGYTLKVYYETNDGKCNDCRYVELFINQAKVLEYPKSDKDKVIADIIKEIIKKIKKMSTEKDN